MKILALETEIVGATWDNLGDLLKEEAQHVFGLYLSDVVREIYFTEHKNAVLVLEAKDKASAKELLDSFPLVQSGKIKFELMELRPYTGYERLMNE
ncbi:MAG: superoxide dismutase [Bacteroidota bacterium]